MTLWKCSKREMGKLNGDNEKLRGVSGLRGCLRNAAKHQRGFWQGRGKVRKHTHSSGRQSHKTKIPEEEPNGRIVRLSSRIYCRKGNVNFFTVKSWSFKGKGRSKELQLKGEARLAQGRSDPVKTTKSSRVS